MSHPANRADAGWLRPALLLVAAVTALRLLALAFNRTDLFVDETQYWLWGQNLDFGYYSKPPLIAWLIRAVTELAGSDAAFWIRAPGSVLHGATALILAAVAARLAGARVAVWVAAAYVTAPFVAVGSLLMSTDTVMAPFYAAAVLLALRTSASRAPGDALAAGLCGGLAFLAKYVGVFLVPGLVLAALVSPLFRPGWRCALLMAAGFALAAAPNVLWNLSHDLTTVEHTLDNTGWLRDGAALHPGEMVKFLASQFAVAGPVLFAALLWAFARSRDAAARGLLALALAPLLVVTVQALLAQAYANWAVASYFAGIIAAVLVLHPRWLWLSLAVNGAISVLLPVLTLLAPWPAPGGTPLLARYLGRVDLSRQILAIATRENLPVVAERRDVLADLFHTGAGRDVIIYAPRPAGRPQNYYEQTFARPAVAEGPMIYVQAQAPVCDGVPLAPLARLDTAGGAYQSQPLAAYLVPQDCANAAP